MEANINSLRAECCELQCAYLHLTRRPPTWVGACPGPTTCAHYLRWGGRPANPRYPSADNGPAGPSLGTAALRPATAISSGKPGSLEAFRKLPLPSPMNPWGSPLKQVRDRFRCKL